MKSEPQKCEKVVKTHLTDSRTQRLKVLLVLGVETDGAARIHAVEGHLFRRATVERLQSGKRRHGSYNKKIRAN